MTLHPAAMVVRAGVVRDVETLKEKVEDAIDEGDGPTISVFCDVDRSEDDAGLSFEELCAVSEIPNGKVQLSTGARLEEAGFRLVLDTSDDQARTHYNVIVAEPVQESELLRFIECFDEPIPNPKPKRKPR
jgi:hypothetical protein